MISLQWSVLPTQLLLRLLCAAISTTSGAALAASPACEPHASETLLQQIDQRLTKQPVWMADFQQHNHLSALQFPLLSSGQVFVDSAAGVVWQVQKPIHNNVILTEFGIDLGAGRLDATRVFASLLIEIVSGRFAGLPQNFTVNGCISEQAWQLQLIPTNPYLAQRINRMSFSGATWVEHMWIHQPGDNRLQVTFAPPQPLTQLAPDILTLLDDQ